MEKYYTPKIEEFHVGFEFEISLTSIGGLDIVDFSKDPIQVQHISKPNHKIWEKSKVFFDTSYGFKNKLFRSIEQLKEILDDGNIRVKYLDKEDIESLGFKFLKNEINSNDLEYKELFEKENIGLVYNYNNKTVGMFTLDLSKNGVYSEIQRDPNLVNRITIKNKSELKKLLKQLNVKYNEKSN